MFEAKSLWTKALTGDAGAVNAILRRQTCPNVTEARYIIQMVVEAWLAICAACTHGGSVATASGRVKGACHALSHLLEAESDVRRTMLLVGLRHCVVDMDEGDRLESAEISLTLVCGRLEGLEEWVDALAQEVGMDVLMPIAKAWLALERAWRRVDEAYEASRQEERPTNFAVLTDAAVAAALHGLQCTASASVNEAHEEPFRIVCNASTLVFQATVTAEKFPLDAERLLHVSMTALRAAADVMLYLLQQCVGECLAE